MSGAGQERHVETSAVDIGLRAAEWLERRHHDNWTDEDQASLDAWLAQSLAHRIAYLRLEDAWTYADRLTALRTSPREKRGRARTIRRMFGGVAVAAVAIALLGIGAAAYLSNPREQVYATEVGGHKHVTLDDGSRIELNTDTVLHIASAANKRTVRLDKGEAYFQVTHDPKRPFVVMADGRRLTDLGTKFLVREDEHRLRVAVFDGRVQFDPADRGANMREALLTSGDVLLATADSQSIRKENVTALATDIGWRRGVVTLDNTTLADAAAEFNRYNNRKLIIADPDVGRLRMVGTFQTDNLDAFSSVARDIFGLRVEKRDTQIVISR